jgi:uncharacterized protein YyaL (SSP411 family)
VQLEQSFDFTHGGFGRAPKFPHPLDLGVLLRFWKREPSEGVLNMVRLTLDKMARGGIYDHLAGGFARYSVDERWLVPHFEKMLYDNALLTNAYLEGYLATGDEDYARVARETCDYILNYMTDETGGFHSTEDADSEGEEGKFYVWSPAEIMALLGAARGNRFCQIYNVTPEGNFEGQNILNLKVSLQQYAKLHQLDFETLRGELAADRARLLAVRDQRVRPGKDDKILVNWNGLMIDALARAAGVLDDERYLHAAQRATTFLLAEVRGEDGRLLHTYRSGSAKFNAYLDDYAYLANALVSLYEADFNERWIDEAVALAEYMLEHFHDPHAGAFFYTADDHEQLIARQKDFQDSSVPSGNGMAATALLRLATLTGRNDFYEAARDTLEQATGLMEKAPTAAGQLLIAADLLIGPRVEWVLCAGDDPGEFHEALASLRAQFLPNKIVASRTSTAASHHSEALDPLFADRTPREGRTTLYICENFTCQAPLVGGEAIRAAISA